MDDERLMCDSRHIMLPEIDLEGQRRRNAARVLLVGAGGIASPAALSLASAGVVDLTNLRRQIVRRESGVGMNKRLVRQGSRAGVPEPGDG